MNELVKYDMVTGEVLQITTSGAIISLENGLKAYAYCSLRQGDRILCSIRKIDELKQRIIVNIDSVLSYAA